MSLPPRFLDWFSARGWTPRPHQLAVLRHAEARQSVLLISPTGGGKTLAGFLPSLAEITQGGAATMAYARLQFEELSSANRSSIEAALRRYCELDTLAMVMIYEAWRQLGFAGGR